MEIPSENYSHSLYEKPKKFIHYDFGDCNIEYNINTSDEENLQNELDKFNSMLKEKTDSFREYVSNYVMGNFKKRFSGDKDTLDFVVDDIYQDSVQAMLTRLGRVPSISAATGSADLSFYFIAVLTNKARRTCSKMIRHEKTHHVHTEGWYDETVLDPEEILINEETEKLLDESRGPILRYIFEGGEYKGKTIGESDHISKLVAKGIQEYSHIFGSKLSGVSTPTIIEDLVVNEDHILKDYPNLAKCSEEELSTLGSKMVDPTLKEPSKEWYRLRGRIDMAYSRFIQNVLKDLGDLEEK